MAIICSIKGYSQDSRKLHEIDSLVNVIRTSGFTTSHDSITNDYPDLGLFMKTYLTMITNEGQLKNFVNYVKTRRVKVVSSGTPPLLSFYQHKLIKVEESAVMGDEHLKVDWYYADSKPLYYTLKTDRSEERCPTANNGRRNAEADRKIIYMFLSAVNRVSSPYTTAPLKQNAQ